MSKHDPLQDSLESRLDRLRMRQRLRDALLLGGRGAFYACVLAVMTALVAALAQAPWSRAALWISPGLIPAGALLGALVGMLRRVDNLHVARALDHAAAGEDRFASALQLSGHHRPARAQLLLNDALETVARVGEKAAIPLRAARELKWLPAPAAALIAVLWLAPGPRQAAQAAHEPEVAPDEWQALHRQLEDELKELPPPQTPEERELADQLQKLADLLKQQPDKKEALAEIAKLRSELEKTAQALGSHDVSMRQAAQAMRSSAALARFAMLLKAGDYQMAAAELEAVAQQLKENQLAMSAEDFEAAASDLENLSRELAGDDELSECCRNAAGAASRMNREELSKALKRLSQCTGKNASKLRKCDGLCRSRSILDQLAKRLSQCKGCKNGVCSKCGSCNCNGSCSAFVKYSNKKGGLKAGWGTAARWDGGKLHEAEEQRMPVLAETPESSGEISVTPTISPDERAASAQDFKEMYTNMVRKAEADLELETVPGALRDYLRRYFVAIKPADEATTPKSGQ